MADQLENPYLVGAVFYLVPFLLTQVMQNRTVMAIFQPIAILACRSMGVSCVGPTILVAAACCTAFMTPMATASIQMCIRDSSSMVLRECCPRRAFSTRPSGLLPYLPASGQEARSAGRSVREHLCMW